MRASTLEQSLRTLGVEKLSKEDVQKMQWEALEVKIGSWIQYMRISVGFNGIFCEFSGTVIFCLFDNLHPVVVNISSC